MIGAAMSRRAGLEAATALVLALTAGTGCAGPATRHAPERGHLGVQVAAAEPEPAAVSLPRMRGGLPWPVALRTADGMYVIGRNGAIRQLRPAAPYSRARAVHPAGFVWVNRPADTWATMRGGRLVIVRNRAVIWQSTQRYPVQDAAHMNQILTGRPGVAFEVRESGPWLMAGWHGPEHLVAVAGWPEMWTRSGNLIAVLHQPGSRSFGYAVFSPSGARLATLATGLTVSQVDQGVDDLATGTFWYLTGGGDLARTDGVATRVIANTRALGFTSAPSVGTLGSGLIQLVSANWREGQVILTQRRAARGVHAPAPTLPAADHHAHPRPSRALRRNQRQARHPGPQHRGPPQPLPGDAAPPSGNRRPDQHPSRDRENRHTRAGDGAVMTISKWLRPATPTAKPGIPRR